MEILLLNQSTDLYQTFPVHEHGYWEIILNTVGRGMAEINGVAYPFSEGTIFCIPPYTPHRKISEQGFSDACIFIRDFEPLTSTGVAAFEDDAGKSFLTLFQIAYQVQMRAEENAQAIIHAIGDVLYQLLVGWSGRQKRHEPVEHFLEVILENISNCHFDLAAEVTKIGYSASHFRKLFREHTGKSPLQYMNKLRIEQSKRLLQQYHGIHAIKEIGLSCGFSDPYYFSRLFKQYEGISPEKYIQNLGVFAGDKIAITSE